MLSRDVLVIDALIEAARIELKIREQIQGQLRRTGAVVGLSGGVDSSVVAILLARALGPDIRVNAVLPGFTETRWLKQGLGDAYEPAREAYRKQSALQSTLAPEDVAEAIVALLHARKITGQLLTIDAGRALGPA